jgi:hypothetical protein
VQHNPLVPFLVRHCVVGIVAGLITAGGLLATDVAALGSLVLASELFPVPLIMLLAFFGLTFGSLAMGAAIMRLGDRPAEQDGAVRRAVPADLLPTPAGARGPR